MSMENSELYQKYHYGNHWEDRPGNYANHFIDFLKKRSVEKGILLDIGCGSGRDVDIMTRNLKLKVFGLDVDRSVIERAKKSFPKSMFICQNSEEISFTENYLTAAFAINVMHYLNYQLVLENVWNMLISGGYFFVHFNTSITDINGKIDYQDDIGEIKRMLNKFQIIYEQEFERIDFLPIEHTHKILELILQKPLR